jgi:hypothetical protein
VEGWILQNSLFISLLAGNSGLRRVRDGLRPQPASVVTVGRFRLVKSLRRDKLLVQLPLTPRLPR